MAIYNITGTYTSKADSWIPDNWTRITIAHPELTGYWDGSMQFEIGNQLTPANDTTHRINAHNDGLSRDFSDGSDFLWHGNYVHPDYTVCSINGVSIPDGILYYAGSPSSFSSPPTPGSILRNFLEVMSTADIASLVGISFNDEVEIVVVDGGSSCPGDEEPKLYKLEQCFTSGGGIIVSSSDLTNPALPNEEEFLSGSVHNGWSSTVSGISSCWVITEEVGSGTPTAFFEFESYAPEELGCDSCLGCCECGGIGIHEAAGPPSCTVTWQGNELGEGLFMTWGGICTAQTDSSFTISCEDGDPPIFLEYPFVVGFECQNGWTIIIRDTGGSELLSQAADYEGNGLFSATINTGSTFSPCNNDGGDLKIEIQFSSTYICWDDGPVSMLSDEVGPWDSNPKSAYQGPLRPISLL